MSFKVQVQVKTRSSREMVEVIDESHLVVRVGVPPVDGKANERIIELLSAHFKVSKSKVLLVSGPKSKVKVFQIETP